MVLQANALVTCRTVDPMFREKQVNLVLARKKVPVLEKLRREPMNELDIDSFK